MRIFSRINAFSSSGRQLKLKENMKMLNALNVSFCIAHKQIRNYQKYSKYLLKDF